MLSDQFWFGASFYLSLPIFWILFNYELRLAGLFFLNKFIKFLSWGWDFHFQPKPSTFDCDNVPFSLSDKTYIFRHSIYFQALHLQEDCFHSPMVSQGQSTTSLPLCLNKYLRFRRLEITTKYIKLQSNISNILCRFCRLENYNQIYGGRVK